MASINSITLISLMFFVTVFAASLPDYVKICSKSDPNLNECALKSGNDALPKLIDGVKSLKVPKLNPLKLPLVEVESGPNLKISLKDIVISGFDTMTLSDVDLNLKKSTCELTLHAKEIKLDANYDIKGQILVLPITGNGPAHIKFEDIDFHYSFAWEEFPVDGVVYSKTKDGSLKWSMKRSHYVLENLFGGDKRLGDEMNKFLDENWQDVNKEIGPAVTDTIEKIVHGIVSTVGATIPLEGGIFLP